MENYFLVGLIGGLWDWVILYSKPTYTASLSFIGRRKIGGG
jgi:hypothetical protein